MEWVPKHEAKLFYVWGSHKYNWRTKGPWIFQGINYFCRAGGYDVDSSKQAKFEWDSDEDNVLQIGDTGCKLCGSMDLLGFHPYKEVIFFRESMERALAYHLNSSKVQDLGKLYPRNYCNYEIRGSFPCTPCYIVYLRVPVWDSLSGHAASPDSFATAFRSSFFLLLFLSATNFNSCVSTSLPCEFLYVFVHLKQTAVSRYLPNFRLKKYFPSFFISI